MHPLYSFSELRRKRANDRAMNLTITEKIFRSHCGEKAVKAGDFVEARLDFMLGNDITAPLAIKQFEELGAKKVFDKRRIGLIPDHFTPAKDMKSANQARVLRDFAEKYNILDAYQFLVG